MSAAEWRDSLARDYADAPDFEQRAVVGSTCFGCWHATHLFAECPEPRCPCGQTVALAPKESVA